MSYPWLNLGLWLLPITLLWFTLVRQLSTEWSLNTQYFYGWAVPGLCSLLFYRDLQTKALPSKIPELSKRHPARRIVVPAVLALLAYTLTRLVQEANPDWRLVSWSMAFEVIGLTALILKITLPVSVPVFPLAFFLTAVPWPTLIEAPVISHLGKMIATATAEVIGWLGIPAVLRGNVIEVGAGTLGIDTACSGFYSLQVALMLALFFAHWYRLCLYLRLVCLMAALVLSVALNLTRTILLATIAATKGLDETARWHGLVGVLIPLGCFLGIWLVTRLLQDLSPVAVCANSTPHNICRTGRLAVFLASFEQSSLISVFVLTWIGLTELSVRVWYNLRESKLPPPVTWHIEPDKDRAQFHSLPVSQGARQILRCDQAVNMTWIDEHQFQWQAIFLCWKPGGTAARLPRNHTPDDCLTASGYHLLEQPGWRLFSAQGLEFPFRCYVTGTEQAIVRVFYCLWEDRASQRHFDARWLTYRERLEAVSAGRRNLGQRSLELAVWGAPTQQEAESALQLTLNQILKVDR